MSSTILTTPQNETTSNQPAIPELTAERTTILITSQTPSSTYQADANKPQSTTSLVLSTTKRKSSNIPETSSKTTLSVDQTTIISNTSSTIASEVPGAKNIFVLSFIAENKEMPRTLFSNIPQTSSVNYQIRNTNLSRTDHESATSNLLFVAVMGMIVICLCLLYIRTLHKQRRSSDYKGKKDTIPLETEEAKISATAVLYDDIEPTFISHLRGTNEENETKTTRNKQITDSDLNSVNRETKDKLTKEIKEAKFTKPAVLYDEIEPDKEVSFLLPLRGTDVEQELETTQNQQIIESDTNLYVDCPNNVYDKMFVSRSHVNENQGNVYHKVDLRNNRYSLVKPIGTETSYPK